MAQIARHKGAVGRREVLRGEARMRTEQSQRAADIALDGPEVGLGAGTAEEVGDIRADAAEEEGAEVFAAKCLRYFMRERQVEGRGWHRDTCPTWASAPGILAGRAATRKPGLPASRACSAPNSQSVFQTDTRDQHPGLQTF